MGEEQILGVTKAVNWLLAKPALALFALLHVTPDNPQYPIPNYFACELLVVLASVIFFLWLKGRISADRPGGTQQVMEMVLTNPMGVGVKDLIDDIVGHGNDRHIAMMGTIAIFILFCNLAGLIPNFMSPTAEKTVPLGCATIVFLYYNWYGVVKHGAGGYALTWLGPVKNLIVIIMLPVETISHFARLLSLTVRLWANIMVGEMLYLSFLGLSIALLAFASHASPIGYITGIVPVGIPMLLIAFHIFEALLQAFIFTILAIIYLSLAVAEEH
jgi:F-type H+-transporting ATPase subunit a